MTGSAGKQVVDGLESFASCLHDGAIRNPRSACMTSDNTFYPSVTVQYDGFSLTRYYATVDEAQASCLAVQAEIENRKALGDES